MSVQVGDPQTASFDPHDPGGCRLALDRSIPVPLWFQVEVYLAEAISDQRIQHGELIGTERQLTDRFAVSRSTVRQAVSRLRARGLVIEHRTRGIRAA